MSEVGGAGGVFPRALVRRSAYSARGPARARMSVNVTPVERALIEEGARARGVSMARFLVDCAVRPVGPGALDGAGAGELVELLRGYRRQLEGAMTNLNQIAHHANTARELPADFGRVTAAVADTIEDVNAILEGARR